MANCLWNDFEGHRKIHLANWQLVCMKKEFGGLGIPNIRDLNTCLLGSWVKRFMQTEDRLWKQIVGQKYLSSAPNIFCADNTDTSNFWKGVMWAAQAVKFGHRWVVGDGQKIKFWEDCWFGSSPLAVQFWELYSTCSQQCQTISQVWDGSVLKLTFRRNFTPILMEKWYALEAIAQSISVTSESDSLIWSYKSS